MVKNIHNLRSFLDIYCKKNNKNIFYISEDKSKEIKYFQLIKILKNFSFILKKKKIRKNNKILVVLDNSLELLLTFLGTLYNHRVFIPINPNSGTNEIDYIVKKTNPSLIITNTDFKKKVNHIKNTKKLIISNENFFNFLFNKNLLIKDDNFSDNQNLVAQILFTSGSTGNPKGVILTHRSILVNLFDIHNALKIKTDKPRFLSVTPLYHNNGQFIPTLLPIILNGSTITISPDTSLLNFWPTCVKFKINYSSIMATHINYFNLQKKIKRHNLKSLFCGGAKLDKLSQKRFEKKFNTKVLCNYGLTETSSIASTESLHNKNYYYGSVGKALKGNKIKIKKSNSKYGEILIKGENLFRSYYGERKLTNLKKSNKWFKTGDLGYINKSNYLFIKDRVDNMIIVSGENIYPSEIEKYTNNLKNIKLGILSSIPDRITQNKLIFVYESKKKIEYEKFYNFLKKKISKNKIPKKVINIRELGKKEIPKAPNKKILRKNIRILLEEKLT